MNRPRCARLAWLATGLLTLCNAAPASQSPQQSLADEFMQRFLQEVQEEDVLGAAFAVASREGIISIGTAGYTDTSHHRAIDADTAFRIASVSKTFAAELTAQMVQDGRLGWDDPVTQYLPAFRIKGDASKIRIRHLLGQSTGLIPHAYDNLIEDGRSAEEIQQRLADLPLICVPGKCYSYQNSVFSLIGPVVEHITANSYARLLDQRIFKPLGMKTASVGYEAFMANGNRAEPHVLSNGRWKTIPVSPNYYRVAPAAGINASVRDMGKWLMAQLGANPLVIAPEVVHAVTQPRVRTPGDLYRREWKRILTDAHYGLGWRVYQLGDEQIVYHSGWVSGYRADVAWSAAHNIGIAVLMNVESPSINTMTTQFWELAFARLKPLPTVAGF
jgi:beta-lactamase class C